MITPNDNSPGKWRDLAHRIDDLEHDAENCAENWRKIRAELPELKVEVRSTRVLGIRLLTKAVAVAVRSYAGRVSHLRRRIRADIGQRERT